MAMNFIVSVVIIWVNKFVYLGGFKYNVCMTALHFLFTFLGLEICRRKKMFEFKWVSIVQVLPICAAFSGFVVFNNLSLQYNPVGVYQLYKVMTTPVIVVVEYFAYNTVLPKKEAMALVPIIIGIGIATVDEVSSNVKGTTFAILGMLSTSLYQIFVKTEKERLDLSSMQLLYLQAPLSMVILLFAAPFCEDVSEMIAGSYSLFTLGCLVLSACLAFLVNLSIFLIIGRSSPISYNVLGHAKLCTILLSSAFLFAEEMSQERYIGVFLALIGIFAYTHIKITRTTAVAKAS